MARPADSAETTTGRLGHVSSLDGLRGIALLMVVSSHFPILLFYDKGIFSKFALSSGWVGVDLFFALSGFLITCLLIEEHQRTHRVDVARFYGRRAARLLPALVLLLGAHLLYTMLELRPADVRIEVGSVVAALFYVENWHVVHDPFHTSGDLGHVWSLGVEEQFYLVWPFVIGVVLKRLRGRWAFPSVLVVLALAMTLHRAQVSHVNVLDSLIRTDTRPVALVLGAAMAWLWKHGGVWPALCRGVLPFAVVVLGYAAVQPISRENRAVSLASIAAPLIVLAAVEGRSPLVRVFRLRPLQAIGRISYGFYLWHHPVFWIVLRHQGSRPVAVRFALAGVLSTALAVASFFLVERPIRRRWSDRLQPRFASATPPATFDEPLPIFEAEAASLDNET